MPLPNKKSVAYLKNGLTRQNRKDDILRNHATNLVILDVLPPMKYESAESYRRSWQTWQPETHGEALFNLENLTITAGEDIAYAHSYIRAVAHCPTAKRLLTWCAQRFA
jgi:ketosteroid isomerase-like protein